MNFIFCLLRLFVISSIISGCQTAPTISSERTEALKKAFERNQVRMVVSPCVHYNTFSNPPTYLLRQPSVFLGKEISKLLEKELKDKGLSVVNAGLPILCATSLLDKQPKLPIANDQDQPISYQIKPITFYKEPNLKSLIALQKLFSYSYAPGISPEPIPSETIFNLQINPQIKYLLMVDVQTNIKSNGKKISSLISIIVSSLAGGDSSPEFGSNNAFDQININFRLIDLKNNQCIVDTGNIYSVNDFKKSMVYTLFDNLSYLGVLSPSAWDRGRSHNGCQ